MLSPREFVKAHLARLEIYIDEVTTSNAGHGRYERLAVTRFLEHKSKFQYKEEELRKVLKFFSLINISNQNKINQIQLLGFQVFWLASIYALYKEDKRLVDQVYIEIAKKNGKSSFFAALSLYECVGDDELNASIINVASSREQARIMLDYTKTIIENSPLLEPYFTINRNIIYNQGKGVLNKIEIKASDAKRIQGSNCSAVFVDEYAFHPDSELMNKLKSGQIARQNSLMVIITTAANNLQSPAYEFRSTCTNILEGTVSNDSIFTQIFSLDSKEEVDEPLNWRKANPAIDYIFTLDSLKKEYDAAKLFKDKHYTFLTDNLNLWTDNNTLEDVFIEDDHIKSLMRADEHIPLGSEVYVGLDLSSSNDLASLGMVYYNTTSDTFTGEVINILPSNEKKKIRQGSIDLSVWVDDGYIIQSQTPVLDEQLVIDLILDLNKKYKIQSIGYDVWNTQILANKLHALGIPMNPLKQNVATLSYPLRVFEKYLLEDKFQLAKNPVLRWQFQNVSLYSDINNNRKLDKRKSKEAIDGVVALNCAIAEFLAMNYSNLNFAAIAFEKIYQK